MLTRIQNPRTQKWLIQAGVCCGLVLNLMIAGCSRGPRTIQAKPATPGQNQLADSSAGGRDVNSVRRVSTGDLSRDKATGQRTPHSDTVTQLRRENSRTKTPGRKNKYSIFDRKMFPRSASDVDGKSDPFLKESAPRNDQERTGIKGSRPRNEKPLKQYEDRVKNPFGSFDQSQSPDSQQVSSPQSSRPLPKKNPFELTKREQIRPTVTTEETVPCLDEKKSDFVPEFEASLTRLRKSMAKEEKQLATTKTNPFAQASLSRTIKKSPAVEKKHPFTKTVEKSRISDNISQFHKPKTQKPVFSKTRKKTPLSFRPKSREASFGSLVQKRKVSTADSSMIVDSKFVPNTLEHSVVPEDAFNLQNSSQPPASPEIKIIPRPRDEDYRSTGSQIRPISSTHVHTSSDPGAQLAVLQRPIDTSNVDRQQAPVPPTVLLIPVSAKKINQNSPQHNTPVDLPSLTTENVAEVLSDEATESKFDSAFGSVFVWMVMGLLLLLSIGSVIRHRLSSIHKF